MSRRLITIALAVSTAPFAANANDRPVALYTFEDASGRAIKDRSGVGDPVHLTINKPKLVQRTKGALEITGNVLIRSDKPATKITDAIQRSGEFSIEAWVRPENTTSKGPARIVTFSKHSTERNFTIGQDGDKFDARFRTTATDDNGLPSLASRPRSLTTGWTHLVYTRDKSGRTQFFLDGGLAAEGKTGGATTNWDPALRLAIGDELNGGRPWRGSLGRVAIYDRPLSAREIGAAFNAAGRPAAAKLAKASPQPAPKPANPPQADGGKRAGAGLLALYDFADAQGNTIRDRSGQQPPLDLKIGNAKNVRRSPGELHVRGPAGIASGKPAKRLREAAQRSGALSIEAWVRTAKPNQTGPARMVTLSGNTSNRNFTLGQDGDRYDIRLRSTKTDNNGNPSTPSKSKALINKWTHVVYTRERGGRTRIYLDGFEDASGRVSGDLSNWDANYRIALGDEHGDERRTWLGSYRLVAIYGRALSLKEVGANFRAGPGAQTGASGDLLAGNTPHPNEQRFHNEIAPLLSKHCLECHDTANRKGKLDLSKKVAALASKTIVPGKSADSELWGMVADDEMPEDREPLSGAEKAVLKKWIDAGAHWPASEVNPLAHKRDRRATENWVRRLTIPEYIATVKAAIGVDIAKEARELLPPDLRADGFSNTAYNLGVDLKHIGAYAQLAEIIVSRIDAGAFAKRFSRNRQFTDNSMGDLLEEMGKWLLRGPLEEHEVIAYRGISTAVASVGGTFDEAVGLMVEAMLQSPRFIYQIENQRGDGSRWALDDFQLASRMSYIIWGASPDRELARLADRGELGDPQTVAAQVERMLADPRAVERSLLFASEWLNLGRLENMAPNREKFPDWKPELAADMRAETLAFFRELVWEQKRPLHDLLNAQLTFTTPRLAAHYRLQKSDQKWWQIPEPPNAASPTQMVRVDLAEIPSRGGLLTHGSVLTMGGDDASTVTRGLFVLHDILRSGVNDPPPGVDTTPVPSKPGLSQRMVAEKRVNDKACGGCHSKFEPLAYGLERFDGLGAYWEIDRYGNQLRQDGSILFPGQAEARPFKNSAELMDLLAESERVRETITWKAAQFAVGRPLVEADSEHIDAIHKAATKNGGTYQSLIAALVLSDLVQTTKTEAN